MAGKSLAKAYKPKEVEEKWYQYWQSNKLFHAEANSNKPPYCIVIPPPNVFFADSNE
jgi:valyl-tRNA synthetase